MNGPDISSYVRAMYFRMMFPISQLHMMIINYTTLNNATDIIWKKKREGNAKQN